MFQAFGALIGSVTRCIMYTYYFRTSIGFDIQSKKLVTLVQIAQLLLCLGHAAIALRQEEILPRPYAWAQLVYQLQMILLMIMFYRRCYLGTSISQDVFNRRPVDNMKSRKASGHERRKVILLPRMTPSTYL
mmetsp:Transcript_8016/g.24102  ORF Transcript_8016/g.24102 Transcript_8016/m.24102 type:complete len:132 (+) Transcript_8016:540-935(+)